MREAIIRRTLRCAAACMATTVVAWHVPALAQMRMPGTFAVNERGAATYTIPISVPPGVGGVEPADRVEPMGRGASRRGGGTC